MIDIMVAYLCFLCWYVV